MLAVATVATALVAEALVGSLETFADKAGLTEFFVAAVIVAIVGNAAEHGGAVVVAHRGKIKLAAEIALASSAQVAVFPIPLVALLAWLIDRWHSRSGWSRSSSSAPQCSRPRRSSRRVSRAGAGVALIAMYIVAAAAFFIAGDR